MKRVLFSLPILVGLAGGVTATAQVSQNFDLVFTSGPLLGQSFSGQLEATSGDGVKYPGDGSLLSLSTVIDGVAFSAADDADYPDFPEADFFGGQLTYLDGFFDVVTPNGSTVLGIAYERGVGNGVTFFPEIGDPSFGHLSMPGVSAPESASTALLLGLGVGGLALVRRRWIKAA